MRAVSGRGSLQKAARTLVAATHGRWEIDTATRNSLYHGTFHHRPAHVMLILMLNVTSSVGTLSVLVSSFFFVCQRGSASLGPLRASPAVHSDLHAFSEERAQRETVREWTISADANDTRQDDKVWWCVTQHITAGICGDAASYKYVVQVATRYTCPSRWVPASLHGIDAACGIVPFPVTRNQCELWL